jgi:uncharacterized protein Smg (DUF494 family)
VTAFLLAYLAECKLSLLGALYFDKIVRELKNFVQSFSDKPIPLVKVYAPESTASFSHKCYRGLLELLEVAQVLSCENIDEVEAYISDKWSE